MKKILRRIFAIVMLLLSIFVVCYLCHTCNKLSGEQVPYELLQKSAYKSNNNNILILSEENIWYLTNENTYVCTLEKYEDGILSIKSEGQFYSFQIINKQVIYDTQTEEYLWRGNSG